MSTYHYLLVYLSLEEEYPIFKAPSGKGAAMNEIIIIQQDNKKYLFEITGKVYKHFGVDHVYAIAVYYTGHIIYNLAFDAKYEEKITLSK